MKQQPKLAALANDLAQALPGQEIDLIMYISDLAMYHTGQLTAEQISPKPANTPYYGPAFAAALMAVETGWVNRVEHHAEFVAKAVRKAGGTLVEVKRMERPIGNIPQPTSRKDGDTARMPRTGKE